MSNLLVDTLYAQVAKYRNREFYCSRNRKTGAWESTSWSDFLAQVEAMARGFVALGLKESDKLLVHSYNCSEMFIAEFACFLSRMATVPVYARASAQQFAYIANHCDAEVILAGDEEQYRTARDYIKAHPGKVKRLILSHNDRSVLDADDDMAMTMEEIYRLGDAPGLAEEVKRRTAAGEPTDLAALIYTSGTTALPKGVMLNHEQFNAALQQHEERLEQVTENEISLSFLPMSHVFEKTWLFFCMSRGLRVAFNRMPHDMKQSLKDIRPNVMCCVPRFWEKSYTRNYTHIKSLNWWQQRLYKRAFFVGKRRNLHYRRLGLKVPAWLEREYKYWDRKVFSELRSQMGLSNSNIFPTAGARLNDKICGYMIKAGVDIALGYGMTETTATVTCFPRVGFQIGTVGRPIPGVDIKIDYTGEILVKGPNVTHGYYKDPEATAAAFTADGYFRTGDMGYLLPDGSLVLSGRKKDLQKTSYGKSVFPTEIEAKLVEDDCIDAAMIVAEGRKYVSALIVPDYRSLELWASQNGIEFSSRAALCKNPKAVDYILRRIERLQSHMARYEQVRSIALMPEPFSQERDEVTNMFKLRRQVISENYADLIESLYPEENIDAEPLYESSMK